MIAALEAAGLDAPLKDDAATFTVFAPTDAAFDALGQETISALLSDIDTLADILKYHVIAGAEIDSGAAIAAAGSMVEMLNGDKVSVSLQGDMLFINSSQVILTDIKATNGIIHVIDAVLTPPAEPTTSPEPPTSPEPTSSGKNIVETAIEARSFQSLVNLLTLAGLDSVLADETRTFTVFAPTNEAFKALGLSTLSGLARNRALLKDILLYHVIADADVDSTTALSLAGQTVEMANGSSVELSIRDGALFINDSKVITTDIVTSNGTIHVIDKVLIPPSAN